MTDTPYSGSTATAITLGATTDGWVDQSGVPYDSDVVSHNVRSTEQRIATMLAYLRDDLAALRAVVAPPTATTKIMCVGDSITVGAGSTGPGGQVDVNLLGTGQGYRPWLADLLAWRRITAQVTTVAQGGQTLRTMTPPTLAALPTAKPDIVLLHLGTNDIGVDFTSDWQTRYASLVDQILASSPTVKVACARIQHYRRPDLDAGVNPVNSCIDAIVSARQAGGRVTSADMTPITQHWTADGTHPLDGGYLAMAQQWMTAISGWLPTT